jgi:hypothetical protein
LKVLFILVGLMVVAGSLYADYRWKRWMNRQREQREREGSKW